MSEIDSKFLESQREEIKDKLIVWKRYIDDIVVVWRENKKDLLAFLKALNKYDLDLSFTWDIDLYKDNYLEVDIHKGRRFEETGHLDTRTHIEETNSQLSREWL